MHNRYRIIAFDSPKDWADIVVDRMIPFLLSLFLPFSPSQRICSTRVRVKLECLVARAECTYALQLGVIATTRHALKLRASHCSGAGGRRRRTEERRASRADCTRCADASSAAWLVTLFPSFAIPPPSPSSLLAPSPLSFFRRRVLSLARRDQQLFAL